MCEGPLNYGRVSIVAISCIRPAQRGQRRTSRAKARRISAEPTSSRAAWVRPRPPRGNPSPGPSPCGGGHDVRPAARAGGQHHVIEHQVDLGPRCQGRQLLQQLHRLEEQIRRPVALGALELDPHSTVGTTPEAVLGQWQPQHVAAQLLQPRPVVGTHPHVRVQIEP